MKHPSPERVTVGMGVGLEGGNRELSAGVPALCCPSLAPFGSFGKAPPGLPSSIRSCLPWGRGRGGARMEGERNISEIFPPCPLFPLHGRHKNPPLQPPSPFYVVSLRVRGCLVLRQLHSQCICKPMQLPRLYLTVSGDQDRDGG
jgi:hypothetical protein